MKQRRLDIATREEAILEALQGGRYLVVHAGHQAAELRSGRRSATVTWDSEWLEMRAATECCLDRVPPCDRVRNALHLNALSCNVRHVYCARSREMQVLAEFPLGDIPREDLACAAQRTADARAALELAGVFERPERDGPVWRQRRRRGRPPALRLLLDEAGWTAQGDEADECRVDLELEHGQQQAVVTRDDIALRLRVDLLDCAPDPTAGCAHAACLCLLTEASDTRLVAAAVDLRDRAFLPRLQVTLPAGAGAEWLHHGLGALSVACSRMASEVELLSRDRGLARRYLQAAEAAAPARRRSR